MAITSRFTFVGTPVLPKKEKAKRPFFKEINKVDEKTKKTRNMISMTFGMKESDNNMAFVEAFDSVQDTIMTMDSDNEKMEVAWEDRFDEDIVNTVASYRRYTVDLGEEYGGRCDFITLYDLMQHLNKYLPDYKGKVMVTGQFTREWYAKKNTYLDKFKIQNVYAVEDETKSRLALTMDIYYNKDSIDKGEFNESKKIYLNGYIEQYMGKDEGRKMIPMTFIFSAAKYDLEKEKHKKLFDYKMSYIDIKNKTMVHIPWDIVLLRGAEEADFDEGMLTAKQKEQIELGLKTLDDFKPKGIIMGDKINEYRLFDPKLTGDFADGLVDTEEKVSEFEEKIFVPAKDETLDEAKKNSKSSTKTDDSEDDKESESSAQKVDVDEDDLF